MKRLITSLLFFLGMGSIAHAVGPFIGYVQVSTGGPIQTGGFNISTGTVSTMTVTNTCIASTFSGSGFSLTNISTTSLNATGSASNTTFLRGDNSWSTPAGGGGSFSTGTVMGGGLAKSVVFLDNSSATATSARLTFSTTTVTLTVGDNTLAAGSGVLDVDTFSGFATTSASLRFRQVASSGRGPQISFDSDLAGTQVSEVQFGASTHNGGPGGNDISLWTTSGSGNFYFLDGASIMGIWSANQLYTNTGGTATSPGFAMVNANQGLFAQGAGGNQTIAPIINGVVVATFSANGLAVVSTVTATYITASTATFGTGSALGTASVPLLGFTGGTNATGFFNSGSVANPVLSFTYKGTQSLDMGLNNNLNLASSGGTTAIQVQYSGLVGSPAFRVGGNTTGIFSPGANEVSLDANGTEVLRAKSTGIEIGSAADPSQTLTVVGNASFSTGIVGSVTNDSAAAGAVGESITVSSTSFVNIAATGQFGNVASVAVTAGDWDVSGCVTLKANGSTITDYEIAVSSFSANTTTDHVEGDNWLESSSFPNATANDTNCVPAYRLSLAGTTTIYLKTKGAFSVATPQALGTLRARRRR